MTTHHAALLLDNLDEVGAVYLIDGILYRYEVETVSYPNGQESIPVLYPLEFGCEDDDPEPAIAVVHTCSEIIKQA